VPVTDTPGVTNASNETNEISQQQTVSASGKANQYPCPLCGKVLSRRYTVLQHFPGCARRRGNPEGKAWTDHPKNHGYVPRRVAGAWNGNRKTWRKGLPSSLTPAHPFRPMNGFSTIIPDQANSTARAAETSEPSVATVENVSQVISITALQAYPFGYAIRIQLGIPLIRLNQWLEQLRTLSDMRIRIWLGIPHIRLNQWLEQLRTLSDMWIRIRLGIPHIRLSQWLEQLRESPRVSISLGMFFKILGSVIPPVYKPSGRLGSILRFMSINDRTLLSSRTLAARSWMTRTQPVQGPLKYNRSEVWVEL